MCPLNFEIKDAETASLRRRGYIRTHLPDDTAVWSNEDVGISIDCQQNASGTRWIARTHEGEFITAAPMVDLLLSRILPDERSRSVTDEGLRAVSEVAQRVLRNKRALGPMSTGEVIAAALIFNKPEWIPNYSVLGAVERLGYDWFEAAMTVRRRLIADGKIDPK
jgi:hypothetical protein